MPPEIDFVPDVQNDEGAPGAIDFQPDQAAALFGPSSLDLRPTFIPTLPPAETSPKLEAAKEMALALPQAFGIGLGAVEKGVGAAIGRIAGTGDTLEDVKRAIEEGEPLPVELSAAKARGIGGTLARVGLGLAETAPKIASLALFPGGILAQSIAAGGIFGLDAQGRFSPRAAAVGALLPGAGALAKGTVARALAGAMERGTIGTMHPATQWITEEMGHQAALNAVMLTADSPELIELYHTDRDAFRRKIEDTIGMNLAFGLFGGIKRLRGAPTATQEYVRKNAEKFGKIADNMITQQIVGGAGQQAIEQAIAEAKSRQKYAGFIKFPGDEDVAGGTQPMPPSGEEPPGFVPVAGPQLPPIEPKGPANAVQIGIPAPLPVEVPPEARPEVGGQVREPEQPTEARPPAEAAPPPVEPAKPVEPPKQPDVPQLSGLPEDIRQLFAGTPPPPKKKSIPIVIEIDGVQQPAYFEGYGTTATSLEPINPWISRLSEGGWTTGPIQPDAKIVWGKIPEAPKPAEEKPPEAEKPAIPPAPEDKAKSILDELRQRMGKAGEQPPPEEPVAQEPPAIDRSRTFTEQEAEDAGIADQLALQGWSFNLFDRKWSFKQTEPPKAPEPEAKPEEPSPGQPGEFPKYPNLPRKEERGENIFGVFAKRRAAWEESVRKWLTGKPESKAIIWEEPEIQGVKGPAKGNVKALTRNIGDDKNPWRVTVFNERNGAYMPFGHRVYPTREAALVEEARDVLKLHDSMPGRVMDEQEVHGYKLMKDVPDPSTLVWYKFSGDPQILRERLRGTALMQDFVRDSQTADGKVAFTKPVTADLQDPAKIADRLKWLQLEEIAPEKPAEREIKIVYDEDYKGPRYRYGMRNRPLQIGAQPKGWIIGSDKPHPDFKNFGTIDYPFPLTKEELYSYELVDLGEVKPTLPPAASETGTVPSGVSKPTEGGKAPTGQEPSMTAEPGESPGRSAAAIRTDIRNAKAEIKRLTEIQKRLSKIGDKAAAAKRQRKIDALKSKLSQYNGELTFKTVTRRERKPGTRPEGITTDDGMLYYIVGALGRVPIFMPDGNKMARYKQLKSLSFRTPAQVEEFNKLLESFPEDFEGQFGADGEIARAAWDAAKRAGIHNELFAPTKDGRRMMIDATFLQPLSEKGYEFKTREFFEELKRLADIHYERTKGRYSETAEGAAAEREVMQGEALRTDLAAKTKDTTVLLPEDVTKGTQFTLKGTKVKVIDLEYDEDGRLLWVTLDDGNRYGTQRVDLEDGRTELRMDIGSLKQPKGAETATDFLTEEEVAAAGETVARQPDQAQRFSQIVKLSADAPDKLRAIDVDRVMSEVREDEVEAFRAWLLSKALREDTIEAVANWRPAAPTGSLESLQQNIAENANKKGRAITDEQARQEAITLALDGFDTAQDAYDQSLDFVKAGRGEEERYTPQGWPITHAETLRAALLRGAKPESESPDTILKKLNRGYYDDPNGATWNVQQADNGQWYVERTFNGDRQAGKEDYNTIEEAQASAVEQIQGKPPIQPTPKPSKPAERKLTPDEVEWAKEQADLEKAGSAVIAALREVPSLTGEERHPGTGIATGRGGGVWSEAIDGKFTTAELEATRRWLMRAGYTDTRLVRAVEGATPKVKEAAKPSTEPKPFVDEIKKTVTEDRYSLTANITSQQKEAGYTHRVKFKSGSQSYIALLRPEKRNVGARAMFNHPEQLDVFHESDQGLQRRLARIDFSEINAPKISESFGGNPPPKSKPATEPKFSDRERQRLSDLQMKDRANRDAIGRGELGDPLNPEEQREYDELTAKAGQRTLFDVDEVVSGTERSTLEGRLKALEEKLAEMKRQQLLSLNNSQNRQMGGDKAKEFLNAAKTYEKRIGETINEIADIKRKLRIGLTAEEEEKATPPEKPTEDDLFSQPAPKPKAAAPAKPSEGAMREEIADIERKLALLDAEWTDAQAKNRKKKAREIGSEIGRLDERLRLLKSDLTEGQGEVVLRTPIAENPNTGEMESREYRLRQMTSQEFMDYFRDPMQRMRDFGTVYTPWRAEMRRVYYENGKEIRHDPWYIDAIEKTREEAIEKAASYSGRSAEGWRQIRDTLNKPKGPAIKLDEDAVHNWDADYIQRYWADRLTESQKADVQAAFTAHHSKGESAKDLARKLNEKWSQEISPEQPSAPISAGKEGASKGAGAAAKPISGLTAEESARLAELTAKVEANEPMTKAERDRFVELQRKAGGRGDEEPPEVKSGPDRPTLSLDELPANRDLVLREPKDPTLHRAVVEEARKRMAALFGKDILPEAFRQVEPDFSRVRDGNGQTLSEASRIALEQVLGQKIIFLDIEGSGISFHGAVFKEIPGFIFINARTPRPYLAIFGHEFAHSLRDQSPELYQELVLKLSSSLSRPGFMSFWSALRKTYASNRLRLPGADEATHELTANLVGDSFIDPKFWEVLAAKEPTLFAKLSSAAMQFIRDTWQKLKTFGAYQDFSDIRQAHEAIANTIARFAKDRAIKGASGEGISLSIDAAAEAGERPGGEKLGVTQVAGEKIGIERPMEFIAGIRQRVRTGYFDGSQPVETARTENAWEIAQRMINPETKGAFASELQRAGGGEMAPGLLRNELWDYAVRQAVRGDTSLMEFMVRRSQDFQTLAGEALANGDTALGRGLRAARDRAFGGLWSRLTAFRREQAAATGRRLQQGEAGLQQIIEAIDGLLANIGDIDAFERELRTPELQRVLDRTSETRQAADSIVSGSPFVPPERRSTILETVYQWMSREVDPQSDRTPFTDTLKAELERLRLTPEQAQTIADATWNRKLTVDGAIRRRLWDRELRRLDNLAEKTADAFILSVDKADWLKPESPNEVRDIIKAALKSESPLDSNNLLGFKRDLTQQLLTAGLSEQKARDLANAITKRRETDLLNAQLRIRDRAAESRSLTSLVESIKSSPYLAQQDPKWRFDTAVRWFESNGLSRPQAQEAAKMFDKQFVAALTRAAEQTAKRLILKGDYGRNIPELVAAVRLGLTDPSKDWTEEIAKREGFRPLTPEAQQRLAALEEKYASPNLSAHEQVALVEQMMGIIRHSGDSQGRVMKIMGESFAASLLSGIRTMTLNWLQPFFTMVTTGAAHGLFEPRDFGTVVRSMWNASKNWWPEYKYAWSKDAYEFASEEQVFHSNALKTAFEDAQKNWDRGNYAKAVLQFAYGWQQYVIRGLQAADQAGMSVAREWKMALYGSIAMREAGLRTSQISELVDVAAGFKRAEYERALYDGKTPNEAQVIANEATIDAMTNFFENRLGSRRKAEAVEEAALYDAFNIVGRRAPGVEETSEGFLSRYSGLNRVMRFVSETRREGGGASILTIMAVGFMNVPMRTARFYAGFSPYGILRYGIDKYRTSRGQEALWKQSYANEYQSKARLREAIAGTSLMLAFLGWQHSRHTSDEDAEKKAFAMYVTGSGPSNKTMRDAWLKRGFEPYTLHIIANGAVRSKLPVNRVGQILAFPLGLAASLDDLAWRRKQEQATSPGKKEFAGREIVAALGTYYNIVGAQGVLQAFSHLSQMGQGQAGTGRAVGVSLASTGSALAIPGKSLIQGVTDMMFGPVDRSSVEAAMIANFPVLNALWNGKAINRFGDQIGDRTWSARLSKLGAPVLLRVADTPENKALYQMILDKGAAPPDLRRYIIEEKYGPLSQDDWQKFVKISGSRLKSDVLANLDSLNRADPHGVKLFLNRAAQIANAQAAQSLNLTPKPTFSAGTGTGGGAAVPTLPKGNIGLPTTPRISLPGAPIRAKSTSLRSAGGYGAPIAPGATGFRRGRTSRVSLSGLTGGQQRFVRGRLRARSIRLPRFRRTTGRIRRISTRPRTFRRRRISLRV